MAHWYFMKKFDPICHFTPIFQPQSCNHLDYSASAVSGVRAKDNLDRHLNKSAKDESKKGVS